MRVPSQTAAARRAYFVGFDASNIEPTCVSIALNVEPTCTSMAPNLESVAINTIQKSQVKNTPSTPPAAVEMPGRQAKFETRRYKYRHECDNKDDFAAHTRLLLILLRNQHRLSGDTRGNKKSGSRCATERSVENTHKSSPWRGRISFPGSDNTDLGQITLLKLYTTGRGKSSTSIGRAVSFFCRV